MVFVLLGCASFTLRDIKGDFSELDKVLTLVSQCPVTEDGWQILQIPEKSDKADREPMRFVVFKKESNGTYGFGLVTQYSGAMLIQYDGPTQQWLCIAPFGAMPIDEQQAREYWTQWVEILMKNADLAKAGPLEALGSTSNGNLIQRFLGGNDEDVYNAEGVVSH
jgi:hypothetical protein